MAVFGWLLRKVGLVVGLMVLIFVGYLVTQKFVPVLRQAISDEQRLQQVVDDRAEIEADLTELKAAAAQEQSKAVESLQSQIASEIDRGRLEIDGLNADLERLRDERHEACGVVDKLVALVLPGNACRAADQAVKAADEAVQTLQSSLDKAEADAAVLRDQGLSDQEKLDRLDPSGAATPTQREIETKEAQLRSTRAEERQLEESQSSGVNWVVRQWNRSVKWLLLAASGLIFLPFAWRVVNYFVFMPLVRRAVKPICLADPAEHPGADLRVTEAHRSLSIRLAEGERLSARSEHVRPVQGRLRSKLLYDWTKPFISYAAGLHSLTRVTGAADGSAVTLSSPDNPNSYLMRLDFTDHPGVVIYPKHVVGIMGSPVLKTKWRWGLHSLATWQVRYILFSGTGSLIIEGNGDVQAHSPGRGSTRMEQHLLMGFDSRLRVGVHRTEVFLPYLRGNTPLVDDEFTGPQLFFWQKSSTEGPRNPLAKTFDVFLSAVGKVLGF